MGIFFSNKKPRVSKEEWNKKVRNALFGRGLKEKEIDFIEGLFSGDMHEEREEERGIQAAEIDERVKWLKANSNLHTLTPEQISIVEQELKKRL